MNLSIIDQVIVVLYLVGIMSIGFAMKRQGRKGNGLLLPRRTATAVVGIGDVRLFQLFRYNRNDVDRIDLHCPWVKGHVGALAMGIPDHRVLFGVYGQMDPPVGRDDGSRMDENALRYGKSR